MIGPKEKKKKRKEKNGKERTNNYSKITEMYCIKLPAELVQKGHYRKNRRGRTSLKHSLQTTENLLADAYILDFKTR